VPFVGMSFVKCQACGREVRLWSAGLSLLERGRLTDDATVENEDGTFQCPFCGVSQSLRE
jgi:hypothetical protein